jgi:hypothetical protein
LPAGPRPGTLRRVCDEHGHPPAREIPRRRVLQGAVAIAALAGLGGRHRAAAALPAGAQNAAGLTAYSLAMHLHASASEGAGSIRSQLAQAALHGFDVAWFADHDWRRHRLLFRRTYSFTANESQFGGTWNVPKMANTGSLAAGSGGALVATPASPDDPAPRKGSLRMRATSTGSAPASVRNRINATGSSRANFRGRIAGRTLAVDVRPTKTGPNAWGEVLLRLSHHPGFGSRPTGVCSVLYRLRSDITTRATSSSGLTGIVDVPVVRGAWQTVTLDPTADVAVIWPDMDSRDNSLGEIEFHAVSRRRIAAEYFFGYLRFQEQTGYDPLGVDAELLARYAGEVPTVRGLNGTEISLAQHMNQYGGPQTPFDYGAVTSFSTNLGDLRTRIAEHVHALGGVVSINHPFKPGDTGGNGTAESIAANLLSIAAGGADLIETGYSNKQGANLAQHIAVWDTLSRNGLFLTANGASDDHSGQNWAGQANRCYTGAWAGTGDEPALVDALGAGRCYVGQLGSFAGTVDMTVDGTVPMGAVAVAPEPVDRTLSLEVTGVPGGGAVQVLRGDVDYAGGSAPRPNTAVVASFTAAEVASNPQLILPADDDGFVRAQVVTSAGAVVAFGQPVWMLRTAPSTGVPARRQVSP